jgi:hypothetical protein
MAVRHAASLNTPSLGFFVISKTAQGATDRNSPQRAKSARQFPIVFTFR